LFHYKENGIFNYYQFHSFFSSLSKKADCWSYSDTDFLSASINDVFCDFFRLAALPNLAFPSRIISNLERNLIFLILMLLQRYAMNMINLILYGNR
jgi:hypothetical protein